MTFVRLKHPLFAGSLSLERCPRFLRFTYKGAGIARCSRPWDALDQLDDEPEAGESLIAAVLVSRGNVHIDGTRKGKRFGEWRETADYELVSPQPSQEIMRDSEQWRAWCLAQPAVECK